MKSHGDLFAGLQRLVNEGNPATLFAFLQENMVSLFSSPQMSQYYQFIKEFDVSTEIHVLPKLVVAWLAFFSGDNSGMNAALRNLNEAQLTTLQESSFYYSLKALSGICPTLEERLKYGKLAIDVLQETEASLYMANAKLTYGQILAGCDQYRKAAELFADAYQMFYAMGMLFPAAVALTNELLNRYRIGELAEVIEKSNRALKMSSTFQTDTQDYWMIVHLPLGMCYYEMNKPTLAVRNLRLAQQAIDSMGLFHMHGLIEYYLFKSHLVLDEKTQLHEIVRKAESVLGSMQGSEAELLVSVFRVLFGASAARDTAFKPDIERLEVDYFVHKDRPNWFLIEALAFLQIRHLSDVFTVDAMVRCLHTLRFTGMMPLLQLFLLLLAEMNYQQGKEKEATSCLEEAVAIVKETGICIHFYTYPLECLALLKGIDADLFKALVGHGRIKDSITVSRLSPREKEILELIALGKNNEEVSKTLFISVGTLKWHINNIFSKLEVRNRVEAVQKGKSLGEIR